MVGNSDWPAIAVSADYARRIVADIGVSRDQLTVIPPGVPMPARMNRRSAVEMLCKEFVHYNPDLPLVAFVGRRDAEKGVDLLLYATKLAHQRGHKLQVFVCGATAFGGKYAAACRQIAEAMRILIGWRDCISDELRSALYTASRFVVYPSIHREPFGMVPVEAMSHDTPVIVPDRGGVAQAIRARGQEGGLRFRAWDSGDLAQQMGRLLEDDELHARLAKACREVAEYYSVSKCADRVLRHLGIQWQQRPTVDADAAANPVAIIPSPTQPRGPSSGNMDDEVLKRAA
jgi:glycosyltransferase involved in cell wall biosynthesis